MILGKKRKKNKNSNNNNSELTTSEYEETFLKNFKQKKQPKVQLNSQTNVDSNNLSNVLVKPKTKKEKIKKKQIDYIRHCPKCNNFIRTKNKEEFLCPKCNTPMHFALNCDRCNLWFDVKTPQKYLCPKCSQLLPK